MGSQQFLQTFSEILAPDTARVKTATATLKAKYYPHPESLSALLGLLFSQESSGLRQLAATQARSLVPRHWKSFRADEKNQYRQQLLHGTLAETEQIVRHAAARVITAIVKIDLENQEWLDIFDQLLSAATNADARQREVGTYLLFTSLESIGEAMMHRCRELLAVFSKTIQDPESSEVRINTMLALSRLAMVLDTENDETSLQGLQNAVPQMVAVLKHAIDTRDEDRTTQSFEVFQTLLGCDSSVLNKSFGDLVQFMISIASESSIDEDARSQAISFLMQCIRYRKLKMQALKAGEQLTLMCLELATELRDSILDDDEDVTTPRSALGLLDEMASSLPPSQVVVPLLHNLAKYVNSPDPDRRQGGIMALGMVVEGAPDFIATQLNDIFPLILRLLDDDEVKVRRAALDGVMRVSEELPEELGKEHKTLLPALVKHMDIAMKNLSGPDDKINLDMIKASCNSIEAVVDGLDEKDIEPYLSELVPRLTKLFTHPDLKLKGAAIGAVGAVGASAKQNFTPFFEPIMASLSEYVQIKDSSDELDLRSITIDAMGNLAIAVGAKSFQQYVRPLMQATDEGLHLDHPKLKETSYLFWSNMARVYGEEFKPFLDDVVKTLFESLETEESDLEVDLGEDAADLAGKEITIGGKKVKVAALADDQLVAAEDIEDLDDQIAEIGDGDEDEDGSDDDWDDLDVVSAVAQEKEIAVEVIGDILTHCTKDFLPYMETCISTLIPLTTHSYEGIQKAALGTCFRAYAAVWDIQPENIKKWEPGLPLDVQPSAQVKKLGEIIMTTTMTMWQDEEDREIVTDINRNLAATLKASGPSLIADPKVLKPVTETLISIITKDHACQKDFGSDEPDLEQLGLLDETSEYDWLTIDTALDAVCGLAAALGNSFAQLWKMFEKPVMRYASSSEAVERATAVGVMSECIKAMEEEVGPSLSTLTPLIMKRLTDEDKETKSNAAFAMGLLMQHSPGNPNMVKQIPTVLAKLEPLLQTSEARTKDNAAGCVSRMILGHQDHMPIPQVLPPLLDILPLREDYDENEPVYQMIVTLYSQGQQTLVSLTPQLLSILAEVMAPEPQDQLKDETRSQIAQMVKFIAGKYPAEVRKYPGLAVLS